MNFKQKFSGWDCLTLQDLILAYRKAKADCFFENAFPTSIKFADYEANLINNLTKLLKYLQTNNGFGDMKDLLGQCRLIPKKLGQKSRPSSQNGHTHFSNQKKAFDHLHANNFLTPEFRVIGDFPVDTHIISALWINTIGHKFDACLNDKDVYGARLKRVRDNDLNEESPKTFHIAAIGSFSPYFQPYQKWRNDGLRAIRSELEQDRQVVAVSLDLKSYYHLIDPGFISEIDFQNEIGLVDTNALTNEESLFTQQLASLLCAWSDVAQKFSSDIQGKNPESINGGLTIGLTASRIISNVLLYKWDKLIREKLTPIHYGRYVDDMFLVMHDGGSITDTISFMKFLHERLPTTVKKPESTKKDLKIDDLPWQIELGDTYQRKSKIQLQPNKQKLFLLDGKAGLDLIESIEKEIIELSSERRLMPSPDQLERTTAAKVLSAAGDLAENADTLRRADGLTIHRLSWSLQLSHVETLARDLPPNEWEKERNDFYEFAHNHVLRPDRIFAHYQYLPRLLSFAISLQDWHDAEKIVKASLEALTALTNKTENLITINGCEKCVSSEKLWEQIKASIVWSFVNAAATSYSNSLKLDTKPHSKAKRLAKLFVDLLLKQLDLLEWKHFTFSNFLQIAPILAQSDLAKEPYKKLHQKYDSVLRAPKLKFHEKKLQIRTLNAFNTINIIDVDSIGDFLKRTQHKRLNISNNKPLVFERILPFLFPTRPFTPEEIVELVPECVGSLINEPKELPASLWARYVQSLRGVWVSPDLIENQEKTKPRKSDDLPLFKIGKKVNKKVFVAITNLAIDEDSWAKTACGRPDLSLDRYKRICNLINQAITSRPKPAYVLLPELSLPLEWVDSIANRLKGSGINMIAGTEYRHMPDDILFSEACLVLEDDRLGYPASVRIWQPKLEPAVHEDKQLTSLPGKKWKFFKESERLKPVYDHNGFNFGLMICSELQNSKARISFQGEVDALMILAWNRDLDTFAALVESCALDIHAYTILVNNRNYGDSRVRSPAKDSFLRDLARLRGGKNDYCVTVEINIESLRLFQSRAKRWVENGDPFKPVPEGYNIASRRKLMPPK